VHRHGRWAIALAISVAGALVAMALTAVTSAPQVSARLSASMAGQDQGNNAGASLVRQGKQTFRFDTFGDQAFWGGTLHLNQTIAGAANGGIGPGLSPKTALALGLKVDVDALPASVQQGILDGTVNLDDPATTLALLKLNAVVGVKGFFDSNGNLNSVGIECALCHSTVDNSLAPGIGHRLDGWANRDLNVGAIIGFAPNLQPIATLLHVDVATVLKVLNAWGPGKFDAELLLDGKGFQPDGTSSASLIPPAFGLAGINLHTYTGWGSIPYWNAFVAILEMHGQGTFFDPRLDNAAQFPIAAENHFGHVVANPDLVTPALPGLQAYELSLRAPAPPAGSFDPAAAARGKALFDGPAECSTCHVPPIFTAPGENLVPPSAVGIDSFDADRSPTHMYRITPLAGLWTHQRGGFYHDGRFPTLLAVVQHYNEVFHLGLTPAEENDLVQYLLSI
jgi:cytochrome c5